MLDALTTTGKAVVVALVVIIGGTLGLTAESWNPYTRTPGQVVDDAATPDPVPPCESDDGSGPRPPF